MKDKKSVELSELLGSKDFNQLSEKEKLFVLELVSEEEYINLHKISAGLSTSLNSERSYISPGKNVKSVLLQSFKKKNKKPSTVNWLATLLNYRLPAYQPALALICLIFFYLFVGKNNQENIIIKSDAQTEFITKKEENQLAIIKEIKDTIKLSKISAFISISKGDKDRVELTKDEPEYVPPINTGTIAVFALADEKINGPSLKQDTMLSSYFVSPN